MTNKALEDLQAGRDPFAPSPEEINSERYQEIAKWSKWLTILAAVLCVVVRWTLPDATPGDQVNRYMRIGLAAVCGLMLVASIILGVIALCAIPKHGSEGIFKPALRGIIVSVLCLGLFGNSYREASRNHEALQELARHAKELRAETHKDLADGKTLNVSDEVKRLNATQAIIEQTSQNSTGDQALMAKAMGAFVAKTKGVMVDYGTAMAAIKGLAKLDMSQINRQEQLQTQMQDVKKFVAANHSLLVFQMNGENVLSNELAGVHLPQVEVDRMLIGYRRGLAGQSELAQKMREQDEHLGTALLGALGLLDANWGKWKYSPEQRTAVFDDHKVWKQYIAYLDDLEAAGNEEAKLRQQMTALAKK